MGACARSLERNPQISSVAASYTRDGYASPVGILTEPEAVTQNRAPEAAEAQHDTLHDQAKRHTSALSLGNAYKVEAAYACSTAPNLGIAK